MRYNYKLDENIFKMLIKRNILPTDPNKKIKFIIYYNKFKTSNLVINNNSSLSFGVLQKTNVVYQFKCALGDCISENNSMYVGLTWTTLSRRLTMHLSDTSSIAQHLTKHSCPKTEFQKILTGNTTILEQQNNKQKSQILEVPHIRMKQPKLNRFNFKFSTNILKCLKLLQLLIETKKLQQHNSINNKHLQSNKHMHRSHRFCNIHTSDDEPRSGRKY